MQDWWSTLDTIEKFYYCLAFPSVFILFLQTILVFLDLDNDGFDLDGVALFSIRGILAFFSIGSFCGIGIYNLTDSYVLSILTFIITGFLSLIGMGLLIKHILKLQSDGTIQSKNAIGKVGQVYLTVPKNNSGVGKVNIVVQEKYAEFEATTNEDFDLKTGTTIKVIDTINDILIVEKNR